MSTGIKFEIYPPETEVGAKYQIGFRLVELRNEDALSSEFSFVIEVSELPEVPGQTEIDLEKPEDGSVSYKVVLVMLTQTNVFGKFALNFN